MFDPSVLPARVQRHLMIVGYWHFPADLRNKVDRWTELDEIDAAVAERQLELMATVLAR